MRRARETKGVWKRRQTIVLRLRAASRGQVSWQVTGVGQGAYAKAHPLQVEVDKPESERGCFIHPKLYGQPKEKGIEWARHPEQMRQMQSLSNPSADGPKPPGGGDR